MLPNAYRRFRSKLPLRCIGGAGQDTANTVNASQSAGKKIANAA